MTFSNKIISPTTARRCRRESLNIYRFFSTSPSSGMDCHSNSTPPPTPQTMPPAKIILIRHGQSIGNINEKTYATTPDWKIGLTKLGYEQARKAGNELANLILESSSSETDKGQQLQPPPLVLAYCSPYQRTLETWNEIQKQLAAASSSGSRADSAIRLIGMREEPRLVEQQFGNFQNPAKVIISKEERRAFGRFFYRFPNGESGLDVYSRVTSFIGSMNRDIHYLQTSKHERMEYNTNALLSSISTPTLPGEQKHQQLYVVCVTHGLTLRLFLMRYFQISVQEFENTNNPPNGTVIVMERQEQNHPRHTYYYRLNEESKRVLNLKGDVSTELPVFWRSQSGNGGDDGFIP